MAKRIHAADRLRQGNRTRHRRARLETEEYVVPELRQANARHGHSGAAVEICALMLVCRYVGQAYIGLHRDAVR